MTRQQQKAQRAQWEKGLTVLKEIQMPWVLWVILEDSDGLNSEFHVHRYFLASSAWHTSVDLVTDDALTAFECVMDKMHEVMKEEIPA